MTYHNPFPSVFVFQFYSNYHNYFVSQYGKHEFGIFLIFAFIAWIFLFCPIICF